MATNTNNNNDDIQAVCGAAVMASALETNNWNWDAAFVSTARAGGVKFDELDALLDRAQLHGLNVRNLTPEHLPLFLACAAATRDELKR